jgi:hypothetical protein
MIIYNQATHGHATHEYYLFSYPSFQKKKENMWWWEILKFTLSQCFGWLVSGAAPFATPLAFLGLVWARIFRSPSFFTLVRIAAAIMILGTCVVVFWQQRAVLRQLEHMEKIGAEGACIRHERCEVLKKTEPSIRYHEVHAKQCETDKWRCESSAEDRAWTIWVNSIPGWDDILNTLQTKFIIVSFLTMLVSFILPWVLGGPTRVANKQFVANGERHLKAIVNDHVNPDGVNPLYED